MDYFFSGRIYGFSSRYTFNSFPVMARIVSCMANGVSENSVRSDMYSVLELFMAKISPASSPVNGASKIPPDDPFWDPSPCVDSIK